jgi:SOS-response transcriptional repressor LexA
MKNPAEKISLAEMFGVSRENLLCFTAPNNSIVEEDFRENDILFADSSLQPTQGDIVLAEINGEITALKIERYPNLRLVSRNAKNDCKPIEIHFNLKDVAGVVIGLFRFRK